MPERVRVTSSNTAEKQRILDNARRITDVMDRSFTIPKTNIPIGLDTIIGLIPGVGDILAAIPGLYLLYAGIRLEVPDHVLWRMTANLGVDLVLGSIPIIGDAFDLLWKANAMNLRLLERHSQA